MKENEPNFDIPEARFRQEWAERFERDMLGWDNSSSASDNSSGDFGIDDLTEKVNKALGRAAPIAIVLSRSAWRTAKDAVDRPRGGRARGSIFGPHLLPFEDVPDEEALVFFDHDALVRYLELRKRLGHRAAMMRLLSEVDPELVVKATVRSLLYQS